MSKQSVVAKNINNLMADDSGNELFLKNQLQHILKNAHLDTQRNLVLAIASELGVSLLECAAALLYLTQNGNNLSAPVEPKAVSQPGIKMVRYRLDVGSQHQVTLEGLKKILVEESGVDKNNINNVNIRSGYTLIELPDAMPLDIFQHLKSVEINQHKLDIRRVKPRKNRRRGNPHSRQGKNRIAPKPGNDASDKTAEGKL